MPNVLLALYDPDAMRRETVQGEFKRRNTELESCYSLGKVQHVLARNREDLLILLLPASRQAEIEALEGRHRVSILTFRDDLVGLADLFPAVESLRAKLRRSFSASRTSGGKSDLILIGSSTGGFPVAQEVLDQLRIEKSIVILCQHINEGMTADLAHTLRPRVRSSMEVARTQTELRPGTLYLLAGGGDFELKEKYGKLYLVPCSDAESPYHPSFNRLTESLLELAGTPSACIILSGLGNDGSRFLKQLRQQGIMIVAQDPGTAVAPGMPSSAIQTGAVHSVLPVEGIRNLMSRMAA